MKISVLGKNNIDQFMELIRVFEKTFEMENFTMPDRAHLQMLLEKEDFFAIAAEKETRIVGGLSVYVLHQYYSIKPLAYMFDLAVLPECQRQGIGGKLVAFAVNFCREQGFEEMFVQADKIDAHAVNFYRKTNPSGEEDVCHYTYAL